MTENLDHLLAKSKSHDPTGDRRLVAHLVETLEAGFAVRTRVGTLPGEPAWFWQCALLAMLLHDTGKVAAGFQHMLRVDNHRKFTWAERHEFLSLGFLPSLLGELTEQEHRLVALGVATHHRALLPPGSQSGIDGRTPKETLSPYRRVSPDLLAQRIGEIDAGDLDHLTRFLATTATASGLLDSTGQLTPPGPADLVRLAREELIPLLDHIFARDEGLVAVLAQGAVTMADHLASNHAPLDLAQPLGSTTRQVIEAKLADRPGTLAEFQLAAARCDGHLLLRAPTGGGKTEAALLWAARQVLAIAEKAGGVPRVFYTLPYLASINAMAVRFGGLFGTDAVGVSHSRAGSFHLNRAVSDPSDDADPASRVDAAQKAVSRQEATRLFQETLRVGTPYQLLRGALAGAANSSVLLDAANSVFVLDELHAYDPARLGIILAGLRFWERLGGRIAIVSATMPAALTDLLHETLTEPLTPVDAPRGSWPTRHLVHTSTDHLTDPATVASIKARLDARQSVLVVANNVADAQDLFTELGPYATELHGEGAAALLHSRFRRCDRQVIEQRVRERFRTRRPEELRLPGLVVGTQAVEVSLDVDLDAIHTSGAPLDALLQRFGRVNRRGDRTPAHVVVHEPRYLPRGRSKDEFADKVYEQVPTRQTFDILTAHDGALLSEADASDWLDEIYAGEWGSEWKRQVQEFRDDFTKAFLTFRRPFQDRTHLEAAYDTFFNGSEAVLAADLGEYRNLLDTPSDRRAGRLLADDLLIPLPAYAGAHARWDKKANVRYIEAAYDPTTGLAAIIGQDRASYDAGTVF